MQEYCIPDDDMLSCLEGMHEGSPQKAPQSCSLWKINYLFADIGPNIRITFKDSPGSVPEAKSVNVKASVPAEQSAPPEQKDLMKALLESARSERVKLVKRKDWSDMSD